jgi:hypothetical protein
MIDQEMSQQQAEYEASQFTLCPPPLDFRSILCHTNSIDSIAPLLMTHTATRSQLIDALISEYVQLTHDSYDACDMTAEQYAEHLATLTDAELIDETCTDDEFTLADFMHAYS